MKRDPALICYILEQVRDLCGRDTDREQGLPSELIPRGQGVSLQQLHEHVHLCIEGDLIDAARLPPAYDDKVRFRWQIFRLTWKGHDYLEAYEQRQGCHGPVRPWTSAREFTYKPE